jgi:3-dehydroquinate synthase
MHRTLKRLGAQGRAQPSVRAVPAHAGHAHVQGSAVEQLAGAAAPPSIFALANRRAVQSLKQHRQQSVRCMAAVATYEAANAAMKTVEVDLGDRSYPIYIGTGLLEQGELLRKHIPGKRVLIVTNETIAPLYLDK